MSATSQAEQMALGNASLVREVLTMSLGTETYGIDLLAVQEIRSYVPPTRIVQAPPHVLGVISLRGVIVPILDLRMLLGTEADIDARTAIVMLNVSERVVGFVVDTVSDVVGLSSEQVRPAPELASSVGAGLIGGLATVERGLPGERLVALLDVNHLLSLV